MSTTSTPVRRSVHEQITREADSQEANLRGDVAVGEIEWDDKDGLIQIAFQNVQGLRFDKRGRKYQSVFNFLKQYSVDLFGMAETNTFWPKVPIEKRLFERPKGWFEARHLSLSYNSVDSIKDRAQPGGVASMAP